MLGNSSGEVQQDRFGAVASLTASYGGVVALKGAGTLVMATAGVPQVCSDGNPGMASGGMGDVLSGIIAALIAQGYPPEGAATLGVCLHAAAGDRSASEGGERGMVASDLYPHLRRLLNPVK